MTKLGMTITAFSTLLAIGVAIGCGSDGEEAVTANGACSGDCECSGTVCTCRQGGTCTFGATGVGSGEAGADGGAVAPPDGVTYKCESKNTCDATCGSNCTTSCAGQSTCTGSCEENCTSTCTGTSTCNLDTGANSKVTCGGGSTCDLELGTGSTVDCQGNTTCKVSCPAGGCTIQCSGSATCSLVCGAKVDGGEGGAATPCKIDCGGKGSVDCAPGTTCAGCKG